MYLPSWEHGLPILEQAAAVQNTMVHISFSLKFTENDYCSSASEWLLWFLSSLSNLQKTIQHFAPEENM